MLIKQTRGLGQATEEELEELLLFARLLANTAGRFGRRFEKLAVAGRQRVERAKDELGREQALETLARELRHAWLSASSSATARDYRSPAAGEVATSPSGQAIPFGYERDLQPERLEARCAAFFDPPLPDWQTDYVLLSSGQAGMAAIIHALDFVFAPALRLSCVHFGSYFETAELLRLFQWRLGPVAAGRQAVVDMGKLDAELCIIEPVFCDGEFGVLEMRRLIENWGRKRHAPRVLIFDTTLVGTSFSIRHWVQALDELDLAVVFEVNSGLKLFQGGLELASVGMVSVHVRTKTLACAREIGNGLRRIRTVLGLALRSNEVAVLEAPWFLDRQYTTKYEAAIFAANSELAAAVVGDNQLFATISHPILLPEPADVKVAPFCTFRLRANDGYERLETLLLSEARQRRILFKKGGSFGFRGHRFEVVRPQDGTEPFLRVALGRRGGYSLTRITELMGDVAAARVRADPSLG